MTATEVLRHEHNIILKVLDAVRLEAQVMGDNRKLNAERLEENNHETDQSH